MTPFQNLLHLTDKLGVGHEQGVTLRQLALLEALYQSEGPSRIRIMAVQLGVVKPVVTRAVQLLVQQGFIKREGDALDLRDIWISLTPKGRKAVEQMRGAIYHA